MGPVRQNPIQRTVRSVHMCVQFTVAHNTAQNRPDNFPSCPPDNHHCSDDVYLRERGPFDRTPASRLGTDRQMDRQTHVRTIALYGTAIAVCRMVKKHKGGISP